MVSDPVAFASLAKRFKTPGTFRAGVLPTSWDRQDGDYVTRYKLAGGGTNRDNFATTFMALGINESVQFVQVLSVRH